jgi:AcrR family transcriptional regulator
MTRRTYTKRARADNEARTRRRILDATLDLWAGIGPAATTITAVAHRARVQRLTIYRHFGDDASIAAAAWKHFDELHPSPDPAAWAAIDDPAKRLRRALRSLYGYYRENRELLERVLHDAGHLPPLADALAAHTRYTDGVVATLEAGWSPRGKARRPLLAAAFDHAVRFATLRSLADAGLSDRDAARLVERLIRGLARKSRQ